MTTFAAGAGRRVDDDEGRRRTIDLKKKARATAVIIRCAVTQLHALDGLKCGESAANVAEGRG